MTQTKNKLRDIIKKHKGGAIIMMELPEETYLQANLASIKLLTRTGFEGIYISLSRPFKNIISFLKKNSVNTDKLLFIDLASVMYGGVLENDTRCIHVPKSMNVDALVRAIYTSLSRLKSKKKFVFIDSLTTITLYIPLSETMRLSDFLIRTVKQHDIKNVSLIFNVARDLRQKRFIKDIAMQVDEVISVPK
jgi:hypothetical protein